MRRLLTVALGCLAIAACSAPQGGCAAIPEAGAISPTADEKALFLATQAVRGAALTVEAAVDSGQLKEENARKAATLLRTARSALRLAEAAYVAGDAAQVIARTNQVTAAISEIDLLTKPK